MFVHRIIKEKKFQLLAAMLIGIDRALAHDCLTRHWWSSWLYRRHIQALNLIPSEVIEAMAKVNLRRAQIFHLTRSEARRTP